MAQTWDCGSGFRCRTTAQTQNPISAFRYHSSDTEPPNQVWVQDRGSDMGPRLQQGTTAPHSDMGLRLSHRTLTPDLGAGPSSNTGPQLQSPMWDNVSDTGPQLPAQMWDHSSIMGAQIQVWMQDPSSHTGPHLWVQIRDHAWGTGPHLPAQSQTKPLNPEHPQTLPRTCIGAMSAWRGLNSNSPSHGPASP